MAKTATSTATTTPTASATTRSTATAPSLPSLPPPNLTAPQLIRLSPDLALMLEDQWQAAGGGRAGGPEWQPWLEEAVTQALQAFYGVY